MRVGHVFDFAVILRARRRDLRLRQADVAKRAGVGRGFIVDLEHGKDSVEFGKVLRVLDALAVPLTVAWNEDPPDWAKPRLRRALADERSWAETRPRSWRQKLRPQPKPPQSWFDRADERALAAQREKDAELWTKEDTDRFVQKLSAARKRIVSAIRTRATSM